MYQNLSAKEEKLLWMMESMHGWAHLSSIGCQIFATGVGVLCTTTKTVNYDLIARAHYQLSLDSKKKERWMNENNPLVVLIYCPCESIFDEFKRRGSILT